MATVEAVAECIDVVVLQPAQKSATSHKGDFRSRAIDAQLIEIDETRDSLLKISSSYTGLGKSER